MNVGDMIVIELPLLCCRLANGTSKFVDPGKGRVFIVVNVIALCDGARVEAIDDDCDMIGFERSWRWLDRIVKVVAPVHVRNER